MKTEVVNEFVTESREILTLISNIPTPGKSMAASGTRSTEDSNSAISTNRDLKNTQTFVSSIKNDKYLSTNEFLSFNHTNPVTYGLIPIMQRQEAVISPWLWRSTTVP